VLLVVCIILAPLLVGMSLGLGWGLLVIGMLLLVFLWFGMGLGGGSTERVATRDLAGWRSALIHGALAFSMLPAAIAVLLAQVMLAGGWLALPLGAWLIPLLPLAWFAIGIVLLLLATSVARAGYKPSTEPSAPETISPEHPGPREG
jgi:hypothetical protein